ARGRGRRHGILLAGWASLGAAVLFLLPSSLAAQTFTLSLPGTLVSAAGVTGPNGRPGVALLLAAGKDKKSSAKSLLFLDPERRTLQRWIDTLHEETNVVTAFDLAGNGVAGPLAGMPGVVFAPAGGGAARKVLNESNVDLRSVAGSGGVGRPWIPAAHTGLLELFMRGPGGMLQHHGVYPLPVKAERQRWGLKLSSPPVTLLPGDPPLAVVGPQVAGRRRIETILIPLDGVTPQQEAWSLLPGDERLMRDRLYLRIDGVPVLAVTAFDKIGLLAKKRFRLYVLGRDRSRKGTPPTLAAETDCPLWFPLDATAVDADGDGHQDLVLVHPGGLRGKELQVIAYHGTGGGRFDPKPRSWKLGAEVADWLYGPDLTGDGVPDLLVYAGERLFLYAGDAKGSRPLSGRPLWAAGISGAPKSGNREATVEAGSEGGDVSGGNRARLLASYALPGGGQIAWAEGFQKDGKTVLTVVFKK
ncbi:MAG TPA: VCBS repeat-containing protein, partial [Thermoanaerobaculia bacterium]|nr:VCBS repeat-containing protein [Thermoanaerobaculia bacterium]